MHLHIHMHGVMPAFTSACAVTTHNWVVVWACVTQALKIRRQEQLILARWMRLWMGEGRCGEDVDHTHLGLQKIFNGQSLILLYSYF